MDKVLEQMKDLAIRYGVKRLVLFGSRARGNNTRVSDYDFAVYADGFSPLDKARFCAEVEEIETLKKIDLIFFSRLSDMPDFITREGVIIHDQT